MDYQELDHQQLAAHIASLDRPVSLDFTGNLGDALIRVSQRRLEAAANSDVLHLKRPPRRMAGRSVVIPGGGNLIEGLYTSGARLVAALSAGVPGLVLPHTARGLTGLWLSRPQIQIVCREPETYRHLLEDGIPQNRLRLSPDLALAIPRSELPPSVGSGGLLALRRDREGTHSGAIDGSLQAANFDLSDQAVRHWIEPQMLESAASLLFLFLASFELVVTDRLHIAIASGLLGKPCWMLPNSYGKNRAVFDYSIKPTLMTVTWSDSLSDVPPEALASCAGTDAAGRWPNCAIGPDPVTVTEQLQFLRRRGRKKVRATAEPVLSAVRRTRRPH